MIKTGVKKILKEISTVLSKIDENQVKLFVDEIIKSKKIIIVGAGRVGLAGRGFAMRLGHLGLLSFTTADSTIPAIGRGDLLIVCSGSGETQATFDIASIGKKHGVTIAAITGNPTSRIGKLADLIIELKAPSKTKPLKDFTSIQPMTTLNEQCLSLFFDAVVLELMKELKETNDTMWARHSNLE